MTYKFIYWPVGVGREWGVADGAERREWCQKGGGARDLGSNQREFAIWNYKIQDMNIEYQNLIMGPDACYVLNSLSKF